MSKHHTNWHMGKLLLIPVTLLSIYLTTVFQTGKTSPIIAPTHNTSVTPVLKAVCNRQVVPPIDFLNK